MALTQEPMTALQQLGLKIELIANEIPRMRDLYLQAMRDQVSGGPGAPSIKRLDVPWMSQLGPGAAYSNSDCGPACVAMWLRSVGKQVSVDDVSKATGLTAGYKYTLPQHLITAAHAFGLPIQRTLNLSIDALKLSIDHALPAIVLVHYASLTQRYDANFKAGHWVLVTGYSDNGMILYHDPYWPDSKGAYVAVPLAMFDKAMVDCQLDGNTPHQGLTS